MMGSSVNTLANQRFQREYLYDLLLPDLGGISGFDLCGLCMDLSFGEYGMSDVPKTAYGNKRRGYAGFFQIPTLRAVFLMPVPDIVSMYMNQWKNLIVDDKGNYSPKEIYAQNAVVRFYDRDGTETNTFKLIGVFPTAFPDYGMSNRKEGIVNLSYEFNVDDVTLEGSTAFGKEALQNSLLNAASIASIRSVSKQERKWLR